MSVTLPGSRVADDRRRRRLAVSGDAAGADSVDGDSTVVAGTRHRPLEAPSVSPWLPQQLWKCVVLVSLFWITLVICGALLARPTMLPEPVARLLLPMLSGTAPRLALYLDVGLWILAAELAGVVGWYRSHSQLDFSGRYRVWGWIAASFLAAGFLAATRLHETLALEYLSNSPYLAWRSETVAWLAPLVLWGAFTGWLIDRDLRRCLSSLILLRLASVTLLMLAAGYLWSPELCCEAWFTGALLAGRLLALGLLVTALWRQACYVAYVCPDPPEKAQKHNQRGWLPMLLQRWWKPREVAAEEPAKPTRRRRKTAEESAADGEAAAPKRRRKAPAKARKPAKRRVKPDPEESEYEEEVAEETEEESWDSAVEDETSETQDHSEWSEDDELAQLEALTRPEVATTGKSSSANSKIAQQENWQNSDEEDSDYGGVDDGHQGADMYKGLSKRQRRELKKQQREQSRDRD